MDAFSALERLARAGFLVKGVLYMVVGGLALQVAAREGGRVTGMGGALMTLVRQPYGRSLLLAAAIGLLGYASRFGVAARAVVFALLGWGIVVAGWFRNASTVGGTASSMRTLAAQPGDLGRWVLGVVAAGFVAYGFYEIMHARYLHIRRVG